MSQDDSKKSANLLTSLPFRIIGYATTALSALHLISDLTRLELYGHLRNWISAYDQLVSTLGNFLFGWMDGWVRIDELENHALVIGAIVAAASARAMNSTGGFFSKLPSIGLATLICCVVIFVPLLAAVLLLPEIYGMVVGLLIGVGIAVLQWSPPPDPELELLSDGDFRKEVAIVVAFVLLLIVLNYVLFTWL